MMLHAGVLAYSLSTDQEENVYGDLYSLMLGVDAFATALFYKPAGSCLLLRQVPLFDKRIDLLASFHEH